MIRIREFQPGFYILNDGKVRQFLFTGGAEALLVDAGFPSGGVAEAVRGLTDKPVKLILTHGDPDHMGGAPDFGAAFLHPADWPMAPAGLALQPLKEGDRFSCGAWELEVIETPGHTPGSIALFDRAHRLLLPGDTVQTGGPIYMFGPHRDLEQYIASLEKLRRWEPLADTLLPCHHDCPIGPEAIAQVLEDARALARGELPGVPRADPPCWWYRGRWARFYGEPPAGET